MGSTNQRGTGAGYCQTFPYTEKQAGHNHFDPCSTGDVSSAKG